MKRPLLAFLAVLLLFGAIGCTPTQPDRPDGLCVVTTEFPVYDWILNLLGDNPADVTLVLLNDTGLDPHSFQPGTDDILAIAQCDLFVYVGGASEQWATDALRQPAIGQRTVLNLMEALGDAALAEERVEGMQSDEEEEEPETDEHIWLSLRNAMALCGTIADALIALDPIHAEAYRQNLASYRDALNALDAAYREAVESAGLHTLLFADRFPFRYLVADYGLSYYAAFDGCSSESEASFETVAFLAGKVDALGLGAVLILDGSDGRIAQTVVDSTASKDQRILTLDSMQSVGRQTAKTYLSVMESNLAVLKEALNA